MHSVVKSESLGHVPETTIVWAKVGPPERPEAMNTPLEKVLLAVLEARGILTPEVSKMLVDLGDVANRERLKRLEAEHQLRHIHTSTGITAEQARAQGFENKVDVIKGLRDQEYVRSYRSPGLKETKDYVDNHSESIVVQDSPTLFVRLKAGFGFDSLAYRRELLGQDTEPEVVE